MSELALLLRERTLKYGNPGAVSSKDLSSWARGLDIPKKGKTMFYAGFYPLTGYMKSLFDISLEKRGVIEGSKKIGRIAVKLGLDKLFGKITIDKNSVEEYNKSVARAALLLKKLGLEIGYMYEDEPWCGLELHTYGFFDDLIKLARKTYEKFKEAGVREIITPDVLSAYALRFVYPELIDNYDLKVVHIVEILNEKLRGKSLELKEKRTVTFHDPCYLARYFRLVEEPRRIIEMIKNVELIEPENNKYNTVCDGGGGLEASYPNIAREVAKMRARELKDTGAEIIVTQCPICVMMLKRGLRDIGCSNVRVMDLHDLVYEAMTSGE